MANMPGGFRKKLGMFAYYMDKSAQHQRLHELEKREVGEKASEGTFAKSGISSSKELLPYRYFH